MIIERKTSDVVGGKTARACNSCLRRRARWYCAADDAFLCQGCDSSVHSANQLASRHERVRIRLGTTESNPKVNSVPVWQKGFTRKARTPRQPKQALMRQFKDKERILTTSLVPEIGSDETSLEEETEAQLLFSVPVFDPFAAELCNVSNETDNLLADDCKAEGSNQSKENALFSESGNDEEVCDFDNLPLFIPSEMELEEFAADVESLLGKGFDEESCGMEGLGLIECKEENVMDDSFEGSRVKVEDEEGQAIIACKFDMGMDMSRETIDWNFDYESPMTGEEEEEEKVIVVAETETSNGQSQDKKRKIFLSLNYDEVITSWDNKGCPWTSGTRPDLNPDDDCWPEFMGMYGPDTIHMYRDVMGRCNDGEREARVSRYREKRRTRLFSKKIRYEVRKLNAEKRPRMKGRFVKRTSFAGGSTAAFHTR